MNNYIECDALNIVGSIYQYKDETGKNVNFYYTSSNDYFTMYVNQLPVCFKFKDIKSSKEVEVYAPSEHKYEFDYEFMFNKLRQMLIEFPIVQYIKDAFPLDNKKLDFIKDNCESLSIVEVEGGELMLDIKLPSLPEVIKLENEELKSDVNIFVDIGSSNDDVLHDMYSSIIAHLDGCFNDNDIYIMIGSAVSRTEGLKFYLTDDCTKSSVASLYVDSDGKCTISNLYLNGTLIGKNSYIIKCLEKLNELDFINSLVYDTSVDNKTYKVLNRLGYSTTSGLLVPKSVMIKQFA